MTSSSQSAGTRSEPMVLGHTGRRSPWTIGCSLPTRFVAGEHATHRLELDWVEMYRSADACLVALRDRGVTSIELRDVREDTDPAHVIRAIDALLGASMRISLHLWLPDDPRELRPIVGEIDRALPTDGTAVPCVFHAHRAERDEERRAAIDTTVDALRVVCDDLLASGSPLEPRLELCRHKPGGPVGTTFDELLEISDRVGKPDLRLCWDVGHGLSNHLTHHHELMPRSDFLASVGHTHIHDLTATGRTHGPLAEVEGPIGDQVHALARSGYRGIYDLELEPSRWGVDPAEARAAVERSVAVLREMLEGTARSRTS
jgi:sugar phosphate isomerase/epimerase